MRRRILSNIFPISSSCRRDRPESVGPPAGRLTRVTNAGPSPKLDGGGASRLARVITTPLKPVLVVINCVGAVAALGHTHGCERGGARTAAAGARHGVLISQKAIFLGGIGVICWIIVVSSSTWHLDLGSCLANHKPKTDRTKTLQNQNWELATIHQQ